MDLEDSSSDKSTKGTLEKSSQEVGLGLPRSIPASECISFIRRGGRYVPSKQWRIKNSLLAAVGFLELGNAGDFPANVWNEIPVPTFAVVLMVFGGTLALSLSYFAFKDARLSWENVRLLRKERHDLRQQKTRHFEDGQITHGLDTRLDVNFRELGSELVGRLGMDVFMGFGAILIGIGTFLAIGGANRRVWEASNLLSGYIGNAPLALYVLVNAAWSLFVWMKARQHGIAGARALNRDLAASLLKRRVRIVKMYSVMVGVTGLVGGAGSLIAATMWWGYVMLIPVIISSISCNYMWRRKIGYERPSVQGMLEVSKASLIRELEFIGSVRQILKETPSEPLHKLISDSQSITSVIEFIVANDLFEDFCVRLLHDTRLSKHFGCPNEDVTIDSQSLITADKAYTCHILEIAQVCVSETGPIHFQHQERYLLEIFGCYLHIAQARTSKTTPDMRLKGDNV